MIYDDHVMENNRVPRTLPCGKPISQLLSRIAIIENNTLLAVAKVGQNQYSAVAGMPTVKNIGDHELVLCFIDHLVHIRRALFLSKVDGLQLRDTVLLLEWQHPQSSTLHDKQTEQEVTMSEKREILKAANAKILLNILTPFVRVILADNVWTHFDHPTSNQVGHRHA